MRKIQARRSPSEPGSTSDATTRTNTSWVRSRTMTMAYRAAQISDQPGLMGRKQRFGVSHGCHVTV